MRTKLLLAIGILFIFALTGGVEQTLGQSNVPHQFTPPGQEFQMEVSCTEPLDTVNCENIRWERQMSGGQWEVFVTTNFPSEVHRITDTLQNKTAARYRATTYLTGWACDESGCSEVGEPVYGPTGPSSNWVIGFIPGSPGGCGKPNKQ